MLILSMKGGDPHVSMPTALDTLYQKKKDRMLSSPFLSKAGALRRTLGSSQHSTGIETLAEGVGFEPTVPFKHASFQD